MPKSRMAWTSWNCLAYSGRQDDKTNRMSLYVSPFILVGITWVDDP